MLLEEVQRESHSKFFNFPHKYKFSLKAKIIMLGATGIAGIFLAATLLPEASSTSLRRLKAMEYQAVMSPPLNCIIENGFDYVGNDIGNVPGTVNDCCWRCLSLPGCGAWSWSNHNGGTCWLKSSRGEIVVNPNVKSSLFVIGSNPTCQLQNDVDYPGNDIASVSAAKAEDCCDICKNTLGCRAYSWSDYKGGSCWLKSKSTTPVPKTGVKSAEAYPVGGSQCNVNLEANVDYVGFDIGNRPSSSPGGCCSVCKAFAGCRAFAWTNQNGGTCWLKSISGEKISKQGVTSGVVYPNPEPPCKLEDGVDYVDNDFANVRASDAKDCCYICQGRPECNAFSWNDYMGGTCWLKTRKDTTVLKVGVKSAMASRA